MLISVRMQVRPEVSFTFFNLVKCLLKKFICTPCGYRGSMLFCLFHLIDYAIIGAFVFTRFGISFEP